MELREWLIILGLALVSLIVVDGARRLQRQRRVPQLDQAGKDLPAVKPEELSDEAKEAEINWELPNGGARVVKPADYSGLGQKPKLKRQDHPGPSKVLSDFRRSFAQSVTANAKSFTSKSSKPAVAQAAAANGETAKRSEPPKAAPSRAEPSMSPSPVSTPVAHSAMPEAASAASREAAHSEPRREPSLFAGEPTSQHEAVAPEATVPESPVSEATAPETTVLTVSEATAPEATAPEAIASKAIASESTVSEAKTPESLVSEETAAPEAVAPEAIAVASAAPVPVESAIQQQPSPETAAPTVSEPAVEPVSTTPAAEDDHKATAAAVAESVEPVLSATDTPESTPLSAVEPEPDAEPVLRAEPEDAVFAKSSETPRRRQLRSDIAGDVDELDDDEVDRYRLVDFEGIGRSFKRRIIERRKQKAIKKAEKAKRAEALAKQKAERKALEAEQRRVAKEAAEAEKARIAQEKAQARELAATDAAAKRTSRGKAPALDSYDDADRYAAPAAARGAYDAGASHHDDRYAAYDAGRTDAADYDDAYAEFDGAYEEPAYEARESVVRAHPTLEKALRHDVNGEHARETLADAEEMIVISVLSRDPEGFDGSKLLELMMACGLRYSRTMGVFHRFETESAESELQFSMVNVLKPGTFPIEEMDEFVTPGITFLMPLPGALDSAAAFEAMVETAMVVVRHMGGELKDENRSVMTAQTIEFARQRVREFERRHRLHRQLQAR
ncbi:cell division protein ZipA [Vreelandella venusta]|nr:cell division protein ZipA [Halomonas hydrothermalis]